MNTTIKTEPEPANEQIAARARHLWEKGGRQLGHDLEYWLQAEEQLQAAAQRGAAEPITSDPSPKPAAPKRATKQRD